MMTFELNFRIIFQIYLCTSQ